MSEARAPGMSALIGLGIDLLDRRRLALLISKHTHGASRLANRILSERELASCQWRACMSEEKDSLRMVQYLANRWTVKEAAYKAIYPLHIPRWNQLSLLPGPADSPRKPVLLFHPPHIPSPPISLLVSLSHDGHFTIASVIASSQPI